jgi:signal peptidase
VHSVAVFVWILIAGLVAMATVPSLLGYRPMLVTSGSMSPTVDVGDIIVTSPSDGESIAVGAVIAHVVDGTSRVHRVVAITDDGYRTKGDANATIDSALVEPSQITGVGTLVVPLMGLPGVWFDNQRWIQLGVLMTMLIAIGFVARPSWLDSRAKASGRRLWPTRS